MKNSLTIVLACVLVIGFASFSYSKNFELEPYFKLGTIDSQEEKNPDACTHKVMTVIGAQATWDGVIRKSLGLEYWTMAEPTDDDVQVPHDGLVLSSRFSYYVYKQEDISVYPFAGLGFEVWRRNSPEDQKSNYGDLYFADAKAGIGVKYDNWYCEAAGLLPFWADTDSGHEPNGKLGFEVKTGFLIKERIDFGVFYFKKSFEGDGVQGDFSLEQYGLYVGYRF